MGDPDTVVTKLARIADQLGGVDSGCPVQMTNPTDVPRRPAAGIELLGTEVRRGWPASEAETPQGWATHRVRERRSGDGRVEMLLPAHRDRLVLGIWIGGG
jgi:hypothetical protein